MENYYRETPLAPGEHDFVIIDRMSHPKNDGVWPVQTLVSPMLAPQAHLYPWLLPLKGVCPAQWDNLMQVLQTSPLSCMLLCSDSPTHEVRSQLIKALHFTDEYHKGHILRYYDPRVFFHLCWMLTPYLLSRILPVREITHWTFWLENKWHTRVFPTAFTCKPGEPGILPHEQIRRCGLINQVLMKLTSTGDMEHRQQLSRRIDYLLSQASQLRLPTKEDQVAFALHGLSLRESFWTAPKMSAFLVQAQKSPDVFRDVTHMWDEEHWNVMTKG